MQRVLNTFIMRHAEAAPQRPGEADIERPLLPRGEADAAAMGRWLHARTSRLAQIFSSPACRARMTAEAVLAAWPRPPAVEWLPGLYLAELPVLVECLEQAGEGPVLLIGHNPGLEALVQYLAPEGAAGMPTGAICEFDVRCDSGGIPRGGGTLKSRMHPGRLPAGT